MAWTKLIPQYLGIPYRRNSLSTYTPDDVLAGKGSIKAINQLTRRLAKKEKVDLFRLSKKEIYNFQKKHHIGIDCSGLVCHLLNLPYNPRKTNANMLTSPPLAHPVKLTAIKSGDLVRQKNGHHVVIIIKKIGDQIEYIESSQAARGVVKGKTSLNNSEFFKDGVWRLFLFD